jgi:iron complex outermembrane receptor protein
MRNLCRILATTMFAALLGVCTLDCADAQAGSISYDLDIPSEDLTAALQSFALASHHKLLYKAQLTAGKISRALHGHFTAQEAIEALLSGTGLTYEITGSSVVLIKGEGEGKTSDLREDAVLPTTAASSQSEKPIALAQANPPATNSKNADGQPESSGSKRGQDAAKPENLDDAKGLSEILVTGTSIMNVDVTRTVDDVQPYYIMDSQQIEQSGAVNVEDFLRQRLTMNTTSASNSQQSFQNSGNAGLTTSSINLRGLGAGETLILIDGRRTAGVSLQNTNTAIQPDINGIPLAAIERIEVLPSSASAIYGGAAVGGVVNIVLKKNFNGGQLGYTFENTVNGSSPRQTVSATYGFSLEDGKTRVMLSGNYSDGEPLLLRDRLNLVERGISTISANSPAYFYNPFNPFPGATPNIASADGSNLVLKNGMPLNSPITYISAGAAPGSNLSAGLLSHAGAYNLALAPGAGEYGLENEFGSVPLVKSFMATVRREFTENLEAFTEFSTMSNAGRQQFNPFGNYTVPAAAPTNPFAQDVTINIPSALSVPATSDSVTQSVTVGLIGKLAGDWHSELDYTWSKNSISYQYGTSDVTALSSALAAGTINPFADTIAYPLNLAPYLGQVSESVSSTLNDVALRASGPLGSLPWGRPTLTVGLEHRREGYDNDNFSNTVPLTPGDDFQVINFGQAQSTDSIYAEAAVPLVTAKNAVPAVHSLELQLAGRSERYTVFAGTPYVNIFSGQMSGPPQGEHETIRYTSTNPTIGLKYQPVRDVILRASYSTAFLPPTASQLLPNPKLDCGPTPCIPITDPRNGETYNVNVTQGGNPNLKPQTSKDWDFGAIFEPKEGALQGLRVDLEYYKITQPNYITLPQFQQLASDPGFAGFVTRDPATGLITVLNDSYVNATEYKTNGWDLTLDFRKPIALGTLNLHALGTYIEHDLRQFDVGGPTYDYVGYPNDGGEAKIKANVTLGWEYRAWTLAWTATYVGSYLQIGTPASPIYLQFPGTDSNVAAAQGNPRIPSQTYHEIVGSYVFGNASRAQGSSIPRSLMSNLTIQFGIKNLFNKLPPFDAFVQPYAYSFYGDAHLRDYWVSIKKGF